jgi:hypothetical protein
MGTALDGKDAGSFRVLLHVEDARRHQDWASQLIPVIAKFEPAVEQTFSKPGLAHEKPAESAEFTENNDGFLDVPKDGGYTLTLLDRDGARLSIDGKLVAETGDPFPEVCGSKLNAVRIARATIGLRAGKHRFRLEALESVSHEPPRLLWEGPGIQLADIPAAAFSHADKQ